MRMKTLALFLSMLFVATLAIGQGYPESSGAFVNDFAAKMSPEQVRQLNAELSTFFTHADFEIAVVTVNSLGGRTVGDYTKGLATKWGVGAGKHNGVMFLIAPNERKLYIAIDSGALANFPSYRAEEIRLDDIVPYTRKNQWADGIISGTHAIMRQLDPTTAGTILDASVSGGRDGILIVKWLAIALLVGGFIWFLVVPPYRRKAARSEVLSKQKNLIALFAGSEEVTNNPDVKSDQRDKFLQVQLEFEKVKWLNEGSLNVNWIETRNTIREIDDQAHSLLESMRQQIAFAKEARQKGPELMQQMPELLAAAEEKLATGKQSSRAAQRLAQAREAYSQAQQQSSGMSTMDWVLLYTLLSDSQENCVQAEAYHTDYNAESTSGYISSDDVDAGTSAAVPSSGGGFSDGAGGDTDSDDSGDNNSYGGAGGDC